MAFDVNRYNSLISRCSFNMEAFRGTFQDLSPAQRTMTAVGTPGWSKIAGLPCLKQNAVADGATSGNTDSPVDVTGTFTVEAIIAGNTSGTDFILRSTGAGNFGGFVASRQTERMAITLYTAAGAGAREVVTPAASVPLGYARHILLASVAGGTAGLGWVNSIPVAVTLLGAGLAANHAGARPIIVNGNAGLQSLLLIRCWQGAITQEDVAALYGAAHVLTGGDI